VASGQHSTQEVVSWVLSLHEVARVELGNHSSGTRVAARLVRPTQGLGRATLRRPSTWPCSGWGLPCRNRYRLRGGLLLHRFTLARRACARRAVCSLWHSPRGHPHRALPGILPCGARTFLSIARIERSPELLWHRHSNRLFAPRHPWDDSAIHSHFLQASLVTMERAERLRCEAWSVREGSWGALACEAREVFVAPETGPKPTLARSSPLSAFARAR